MSTSLGKVLYADADAGAAATASRALEEAGIAFQHVADVPSIERELDHGAIDVLVVDLALAGGESLALLSTAARRWPDLVVVVVGEQPEEAQSIAAVRAGASDFVRKPFAPAEISLAVRKALSTVECAAEAPPPSVVMPPTPSQPPGSVMIGNSAPMREVDGLIRRASSSTATVLIRGESGTGKEIVARRVHELSPRASGPFVKVHCAALPEQLLESELFGYEKGAFTGATMRKPGRVEIAEGGSLFLDEIGDISAATQVKLLRVLQDKEYERIGGTKTQRADVRFIAATHQNLEDMVKRGAFREDLYYRLNVVSITSPPLRARPDDIQALVQHFCQVLGPQNGRTGIRIAPEAVTLLERYGWPGNVRQLQNFIERLVVFAETNEITLAAVQGELSELTDGAKALGLGGWSGPEPSFASTITDLDEAVRRAEKKALQKALRKAGGNKTVAARILGVSRRTLYNKLQEHGLT
jgi:two-component system response regulator AtoC